ncbi:SDR family oxidoreductase [Pseudonocardia halophobica]|uniref:SDR family oxidoreductase n=1 Tax=Pseudonocardia halophobica TaxID=29401 RepID=UPI003D8A4110
MTGLLHAQTVLVLGRGTGIAYATALTARDAGAKVIAAGPDEPALAAAYLGEPAISTESVDLTDDDSIGALTERLGEIDHAVFTASARIRGRLPQLERAALQRSFDSDVIGPLMVVEQLASRMNEGGSFVLFSGVAAAKISVGSLGVAVIDGAVDVLVRSLALELAPLRVNAVSPGVVDVDARGALGEHAETDYSADGSVRNPIRRIGTAADVADAVLFAMTSAFLTGQTLHIDGGEPLT